MRIFSDLLMRILLFIQCQQWLQQIILVPPLWPISWLMCLLQVIFGLCRFYLGYIGKVCVVGLLFMAKIQYCAYYIVLCGIFWAILPYPTYQGRSNCIRIRSVEQFESLRSKSYEKEKHQNAKCFTYKNKAMLFVQFYANWNIASVMSKQVWYSFSNKYTTNRLKFVSINIDTLPQLAKEYQVNTSGFSQQLPTILMLENGKQTLRLPPIDLYGRVKKINRFDYKIILRYFDLESRFLQTCELNQ